MTTRPICIVAGVGPGIGMAVARRFAREGFDIVLLARRAQALAGYAAEIAAMGGAARAFPVDLSDPLATAAVLERIADEVGAASVLVYNAAIWRESHPMAIPPARFAEDLALGLTGAVVCAQALYPAMRAAGFGTMLFTGGGLALRPDMGGQVAALAATKSALRGWVLAASPALAADRIHLATVTVAGMVAAGTALDPDRIAQRFWEVHRQDPADWQAEIVVAAE